MSFGTGLAGARWGAVARMSRITRLALAAGPAVPRSPEGRGGAAEGRGASEARRSAGGKLQNALVLRL